MASIDPTTGDRLITVPGKGQVTETQFRQMVANNEIDAGPGGSAQQHAIDSGTYAAPQSGGGAAQTASGSNGQAPGTNGSAAAQAANNMQAPNPGSSFGSPQTSGNSDPRTQNVYYARPNDDPLSYMQRVFKQGTADFGQPSLNPFLNQNPLANSPFAQWYQNFYGTSAPTNEYVAATLQNKVPDAEYMKSQQQRMQQNPNSMGPAGMAAAQGNLHGVNNMVGDLMGNHGAGLSTDQNAFAGRVLNDPQFASQILSSQLQGNMGGLGYQYLTGYNGPLASLAQNISSDPANYGPQAKGSFLAQAMHMLGMG